MVANRQRFVFQLRFPHFTTVRQALAVALLGLLPVASAWADTLDLPAPTGKYPVGTTTLILTDEARPREDGSPRPLPIRAWYPADAEADAPLRPFWRPEETEVAATYLDKVGSFFGITEEFDWAAFTRPSFSRLDARVADHSKGWPVLLYSHGLNVHSGQNILLMEDLASHGYVVLAIGHTDYAMINDTADGGVVGHDLEAIAARYEYYVQREAKVEGGSFTDFVQRAIAAGSIAEMAQLAEEFRLASEEASGESEQARTWLDDGLFFVDTVPHVQSGTVPSLLRGMLDLKHVAYFGMSYGGSTAVAVCEMKALCKASLNMDGFQYHGGSVPLVRTKPMMVIAAGNPITAAPLPDSYPLSIKLFNDGLYHEDAAEGESDHHAVLIEEVSHAGLSDYPLISPQPAFGTIDGQTFIALERKLVREFFDEYLLGEEGALNLEDGPHHRWQKRR